MLISVITPTIGRRSLDERCRPSVQVQTYRALCGPVEHIVHEDLPPHGDWGVSGRLAALERAKGDLIAYLDDDNAYQPEHLRLLADKLLDTGADFAYSRMQRYDRNGDPLDVIGAEPPCLGQIDASLILHRRELLELATWEPAGYASDWDLVRRWLEAGATWTFVPAVTVDYYIQSR